MRYMRSPHRIERKKYQQRGFAGEQQTERLFLRAPAALKNSYRAAGDESAQRDDRTHGGLGIALSDIVSEQGEITRHRRREYTAQGCEADDIHGSSRKSGEQKN